MILPKADHSGYYLLDLVGKAICTGSLRGINLYSTRHE